MAEDGLPVIPDDRGTLRVLGALPPKADFGNLPRFASANRIIPRDQWREIDLMESHPVPVLDQGGYGSCVGHGSVSAFWLAYLMQGGTVPPGGFSPTSLYALVNGGRDRGAVVSDAMTALMDDGVALMSDYPESVIYDRQLPPATLDRVKATRPRFRALDAYHCSTFDAIGSAIMLGFPVSFGIVIRGPFQRPGPDGLVAEGGFPIGGHCMMAYGLVRLATGGWGVRVRNSWGIRYGVKGDCIATEWHFTHGGPIDAFALRAGRFDPLDPNAPPPAPN